MDQSTREQYKNKIVEVADRLKCGAADLDAVINFESAGSYDPFVKNPLSGAMGLIQVTNTTARGEFGVSDSLALSNKFPDFFSYMDNVVYPYLKKYSPFKNKQELYMSIFYPAYRKVDPQTRFPAEVTLQNPGIRIVQDYINFVDNRIDWKLALFPKAAPLLALLAAGAGVWWISQRS
jgi:hypothetical protein